LTLLYATQFDIYVYPIFIYMYPYKSEVNAKFSLSTLWRHLRTAAV
jgi:hypothetical protein